MIRHYLSMALRTLARHRLYAAINLFGLAVGLSAAMLILLYVRHETAYEQHFAEADRIYRLAVDDPNPASGERLDTFVMQPMADLIRTVADTAGVDKAARMEDGRLIIDRDGVPLFQPVNIVDPDFLRIFDFEFSAGDPRSALDTPDGLVLSEAAARRLFGEEDALGRVVTVFGEHAMRVTGIMVQPDGPSGVWEEAFVSTAAPFMAQPLWINSNGPVFLLPQPGVSGAELQQRLEAAVKPLIPDDVMDGFGGDVRLTLDPLLDMHLHSNRWTNMNDPPASAGTVYVMSGVALLLLGMAAINYTNLATARASLRTREVGLRKTVGARRRQLIVQFLGESLLMAAGGLVLALAMTEMLAPWFADLIGIKLYFSPWTDPVLLTGAIGLTLGVGILGGAYPAFFLSSFRPAAVLRAGTGDLGRSGRLRAFLVVVQFASAVGLVAATLIVAQQTRYAASTDLGFDKDNRLVLRGIGNRTARAALVPLQAELESIPGVTGAAATWMVPGGDGNQSRDLNRPGAPDSERLNTELYRVEHDYLDVMGARLVAGRGFDPARGEDEMKFPEGAQGPLTFSTVLNRTAVEQLGFDSPEAALGTVLTTSDDTPVPTQLRIVGVVDDLRPRNARNQIRPAMFVNGDPVYRYNFLVLRLGPEADVSTVVEKVEAAWRRHVPGVPVTAQFLDGMIERMYDRERRIAGVLGGFAALTVAIACLGLFALAAFEAERRTKEIGIRKVLGASVLEIVRLLSWRFSRPVLIANLIAWPVTWVLVSQWLGGFAYRIDLTPWPFLLAGMGALLIAWVTVAGHAARVARRSPILSLRYE